MARYEVRWVLYDLDFAGAAAVLRFRRFLSTNENNIPTPFPELVAAREVAQSTDPILLASRTRRNVIQDFRAVECCMNALTPTGDAVERTAIVPYRPGDPNLKQAVAQILKADKVVNGIYRGERHAEPIQRWL